MTEPEPEQWAVELWGSALSAWDESTGDDPAVLIQRAFEERERELREALAELRKWQAPSGQDPEIDAALARADRALATRQDAPVTENSHDQ